MPNAVPTVGGCSVSVTDMIKKLMPTAHAYHKPEKNNQPEKGNIEKQVPTVKPITWPPIILLGFEMILLGMEKTIKTVEPMLAMMTACCRLSMSVMNNTVSAA